MNKLRNAKIDNHINNFSILLSSFCHTSWICMWSKNKLLPPIAFKPFSEFGPASYSHIYSPLRIEATGPGGSWWCCLYEVWSNRRWGWCWPPDAAGSFLTPATANRHGVFVPRTCGQSWPVPTTTNDSWLIPCTARNSWFVPWAPRHPNFVPATTGYANLIPSAITVDRRWLFFKLWHGFLHPFYLFIVKIIHILAITENT